MDIQHSNSTEALPSFSDIQFLNPIARGCQGCVYNACNKITGTKYAIKIINNSQKDEKEQERLRLQINTNIMLSSSLLQQQKQQRNRNTQPCTYAYTYIQGQAITKILHQYQTSKQQQKLKSGYQSRSLYFPYFYGFHVQKCYTYLIFQKCQGNALQQMSKIQNSIQSEHKIKLLNKKFYSFCFVLLHDCLQALSIMQQKSLLHRDLKPENILISKGIFKICDMGLSRSTLSLSQSGSSVSSSVVFPSRPFTSSYDSPFPKSPDPPQSPFRPPPKKLTSTIGNILSKSPESYTGIYDHKSDIWSLGITVYYLLYRKLPFNKQILDLIKNGNIQQLIKRMKQGNICVQIGNGKGDPQSMGIIGKILKNMIMVSVEKRLGAKELLQNWFGRKESKMQVVESEKEKDQKWKKDQIERIFFMFLKIRIQSDYQSRLCLILFLLRVEFDRMEKCIIKLEHDNNNNLIQLVKFLQVVIYFVLKFVYTHDIELKKPAKLSWSSYFIDMEKSFIFHLSNLCKIVGSKSYKKYFQDLSSYQDQSLGLDYNSKASNVQQKWQKSRKFALLQKFLQIYNNNKCISSKFSYLGEAIKIYYNMKQFYQQGQKQRQHCQYQCQCQCQQQFDRSNIKRGGINQQMDDQQSGTIIDQPKNHKRENKKQNLIQDTSIKPLAIWDLQNFDLKKIIF